MRRRSLAFSLALIAGCRTGSAPSQAEPSEQQSPPETERAESELVEPVQVERLNRVDKVAGPAYRGEPELRREFKNGLVTEDFVLGEGPEAEVGSQVSVRYAGILDDGTVFDENLKGSQPLFRFTLPENPLVKGWGLGLRGMKVGTKRKITVPPNLGYGKLGDPGEEGVPSVPPNARLTYVVHLLALEPPPPKAKPPSAFRGEVLATKKRRGGLVTRDFRIGQGDAAEPGDRLSIHYRGYLPDGSMFEEYVIASNPFEFVLGEPLVIRGWNLGLIGMKAGGLREIQVPAKLAYGKKGSREVPPQTPVRFTVELVAIEKVARARPASSSAKPVK